MAIRKNIAVLQDDQSVSYQDLRPLLELVVDLFAHEVSNYDFTTFVRICHFLHLGPVLVGDLEAF